MDSICYYQLRGSFPDVKLADMKEALDTHDAVREKPLRPVVSELVAFEVTPPCSSDCPALTFFKLRKNVSQRGSSFHLASPSIRSSPSESSSNDPRRTTWISSRRVVCRHDRFANIIIF